MAQVLEHLSSKLKALSSILSTCQLSPHTQPKSQEIKNKGEFTQLNKEHLQNPYNCHHA
jgi:hypothetical protein